MTDHIETPKEENLVHEFFLVSVILKGLISLAEVIVGIVVLLTPPEKIISITLFLLNYLPNAYLQSRLMVEISQYTSSTALFVAFYLLSRGLIKVGLVWGLLKGKLAAYPLSLIVLAFLVLYQSYQLTHPPFSFIVLGVTIFDLVVMYLVYREWKIVLRHKHLA